MRLADDPAKEDYSLRYTPSAFRQWRPWQVAITAIGSLAAMAGYSLAGSFALGYGVSNAIIGYIVAAVIVILTAIPIAYTIADKNIDITDDVIQRLNTKLPSVTVTVPAPGAMAAQAPAADGPTPAAQATPAAKAAPKK